MLELYKPEFEDLWFKEKMMSDEETMFYNHLWGGKIPFERDKWADWYDCWIINHKNNRFYRYLKENETNEFVGEIAYHLDSERNIWLANVTVYSKYRQKGYGTKGLNLLCEAAKKNGIKLLHDDIALDNPAISIFLKAGFIEEYRTEEIIMVKRN